MAEFERSHSAMGDLSPTGGTDEEAVKGGVVPPSSVKSHPTPPPSPRPMAKVARIAGLLPSHQHRLLRQLHHHKSLSGGLASEDGEEASANKADPAQHFVHTSREAAEARSQMLKEIKALQVRRHGSFKRGKTRQTIRLCIPKSLVRIGIEEKSQFHFLLPIACSDQPCVW